LTLLAVVAMVVGACGSAPPSATPVAVVAPVITPDPHLPSPATADQVFLALGAAGLRITATNAASGADGKEPVKRINANYLGWPLIISQYSTISALARATDAWKAGQPPGQGEPPVSIVGSNILITWGPTTGGKPKAPEGKKRDGLMTIIGILDPLLSPLRGRTVIPVGIAGSTPSPTATPEPTKTPKPTKSPKPTKATPTP